MAATISKLNVSLTGNIGGFAASMAQASKPVAKLSKDISKASRQVDSAVSPFNRLGEAMSGVAVRARGMVGSLLRITGIAGAAGSAIAAVGGLGKGFSLAAELEQAEVALTTMLGSAQSAQDLLGQVSRFAAETPFELPELVAATKQLLAFGFESEGLVDDLRMVGDVASGVGMPIGDLAYLFGTARVQGRLMSQDINQMTNRGIPIIGELAKQFGVAEGEVKKLVGEGKVGFPELQAAFRAMTSEGGRFQGLMGKQSKTMSGLMATLSDNVGMALAGVANTIIDAFDLRELITRVAEMTDGIDAKVKPWVQGIANFIKIGISAIGSAFSGLKSLVMPYITEMTEGSGSRIQQWLARNIASSQAFIGAIGAIFSRLASTIGKVVDWLWSNLAPLWGGNMNAMAEHTEAGGTRIGFAFGKIADVLGWLGDKITYVLNVIEYSFENMEDVAGLMGLKVVHAFVTVGNQVEYVFGTVIPGWLKWGLDNWSDIFTTMFRVATSAFKNISKNIVAILKNLPGLVSGKVSFAQLWTPLLDGFESTIKELPDIPDREMGAFEAQLTQDIAQLEDRVGTGLGEFLAEREMQANNAAQRITDAFTRPFLELQSEGIDRQVVAGLGTAVGGILDGVNQALAGITIPPVQVEAGVDESRVEDAVGVTIQAEVKRPEAILAGSAESQRLRFGSRGTDNFQKKQIKIQEQSRQILERIAANTAEAFSVVTF